MISFSRLPLLFWYFPGLLPYIARLSRLGGVCRHWNLCNGEPLPSAFTGREPTKHTSILTEWPFAGHHVSRCSPLLDSQPYLPPSFPVGSPHRPPHHVSLAWPVVSLDHSSAPHRDAGHPILHRRRHLLFPLHNLHRSVVRSPQRLRL